MSMRIGGLASGMDIDTMVSDLMKAERIPLDKLKQKKQVLEWQRNDYRAMNTLLLNFRTELTNMKLSSTYRSRGTTSTDESKVTATASSAASLASYSITEVSQLATAATKVNNGALSATGKKIDVNKSLYEGQNDFSNKTFNWQTGSVESQTIAATAEGTTFNLTLKDGITVKNTDPINVKVNGVAYQVVTGFSGDTTMKEVMVGTDGKLTFNGTIAKGASIKVDYVASHRVQEITMTSNSKEITLSNDAKHASSTITSLKVTTTSGVENYNVVGTSLQSTSGVEVGKVDTATGKVIFTDTSLSFPKDSKVEIKYEQKYSTFSVKTYGTEGKENIENFNVAGAESLNSVISRVNSSNVGVTMFYDSVTDQMTLTRKETGNLNVAGEEIITTGFLINSVMKFSGATEQGGENAIFTLNGLTTERNSNTFGISGVTFTLKQEFLEGTAAPVNINITNNTTQIFDNIKGFVTKYNELIAKIQGEVQEERYKDYTPLTDDQRESLSDKQQEQWEERAMSGMLRRDPTLTSLLTKMRTDFGTRVSNESINPMYNQLASIGIKTSANYLEGGKLEIDEAALKAAIEADPGSVEKLFNATGTTDGEKGIAQRLSDTVNASMEKLRLKAGNSFSTNNQFEIGKLLNDVDTKIDRFEDRLVKVEDRYWARFTAMEKAIQRSNEQMNQLLSYMG